MAQNKIFPPERSQGQVDNIVVVKTRKRPVTKLLNTYFSSSGTIHYRLDTHIFRSLKGLTSSCEKDHFVIGLQANPMLFVLLCMFIFFLFVCNALHKLALYIQHGLKSWHTMVLDGLNKCSNEKIHLPHW